MDAIGKLIDLYNGSKIIIIIIFVVINLTTLLSYFLFNFSIKYNKKKYNNKLIENKNEKIIIDSVEKKEIDNIVKNFIVKYDKERKISSKIFILTLILFIILLIIDFLKINIIQGAYLNIIYSVLIFLSACTIINFYENIFKK